MPRPAHFDENEILAATRRLIATHGPDAATVGAIARAVGAPTGSIYHRFRSRDVLVGEVWLQAAAAFQTAFFERLSGAPPRAAGLAAALYMVRRVREHPHEARLLLLHRRQDFVDRGWPVTMRRRAAALERQAHSELGAFSRRLTGRQDPKTVRIVTYAVLDAPFAVVRRHVVAGEATPDDAETLIRVTYDAAMDLIDVSPQTGPMAPPHKKEDR